MVAGVSDIHATTAAVAMGISDDEFNLIAKDEKKLNRFKAKAVLYVSASQGELFVPQAKPYLTSMDQKHILRKQELAEKLDALVLRGSVIKGEPWKELDARGRSRWFVEMKCDLCGVTSKAHVDNLLGGKTKGCRCSRALKHGGTKGGAYEDVRARRLAERYDAIVQRCTNPHSRYYAAYGARGINLLFQNREHFVVWCKANLPHADYVGVQIDRIDNDGPYAPGNLRLVSQKENLRNKTTNRYTTYRGAKVVAADLWHLLKNDFPNMSVGPHRVPKLVAAGFGWRDIVKREGRPRTNTPEHQPNPEVLALYNLGPYEPVEQ